MSNLSESCDHQQKIGHLAQWRGPHRRLDVDAPDRLAATGSPPTRLPACMIVVHELATWHSSDAQRDVQDHPCPGTRGITGRPTRGWHNVPANIKAPPKRGFYEWRIPGSYRRHPLLRARPSSYAGSSCQGRLWYGAAVGHRLGTGSRPLESLNRSAGGVRGP